MSIIFIFANNIRTKILIIMEAPGKPGKRELKKICVRCETLENVALCLHKTPTKAIVKTRKHYTRVTTFVGSGGSEHVPICHRCKKLFSRWKILHGLAKTLFVISLVVFGLYLIYSVVDIDPYSIVTPPQVKFMYVQIPTQISGIFFVIFAISYGYMRISKSNPHKFIQINYGLILIKPMNHSKWYPIPFVES